MQKTGDEYLDSEEFKEILTQYEESVKSGRSIIMDTDDLADIADYYHMIGQEQEADEAIETALDIDAGALSPLIYKIHLALGNNDTAEARILADRIWDKDNIEYTYIICEILVAEGNVDEADHLLREHFREVFPDEQEDFVIDAASIFSDYGMEEKAMEWLMRSKGNSSPAFKEMMARSLFGVGKYEESEQIYNELIDADPYCDQYWAALGSAQYMAGKYQEALTSNEYALAINPENPENTAAKANCLYRLENYGEALKFFLRTIEKDQNDIFSLLHVGICLINLDRYEEAVSYLKKAEQRALPDSQYLFEIYQELAFAYNELKEPDKAIYYLNKTDTLDCDHVDMKVIKGHVLLSNNRYEEAENMFREAVNDSDNAPRTLLRIIVSLYDNNYIEGTYKMLTKYFNIVGADCDEGYSYMALCCWDLRKYKEFLHYLRTAVKINPTEAKTVLGRLFPEEMEPEEYYNYMYNKLRE